MNALWSAVREVIRPPVVICLWAAYIATALAWSFLRIPLVVVPIVPVFAQDVRERSRTRAGTDTHSVLIDTARMFRYLARPKHCLWLLFVSAFAAAYLPPIWDFTKHNTDAVIAAIGAVSAFMSLCLVAVTVLGIAVSRGPGTEQPQSVPVAAKPASEEFDVRVILREVAKLRRTRR